MVSLYRIQNQKSQNAEFWIGLTLQIKKIKKLAKKYVGTQEDGKKTKMSAKPQISLKTVKIKTVLLTLP